MAEIDRSVLVNYSAGQMYALVEDVVAYPQFLPWCSRAEFSLREPGHTIATLHIDFRGFKQKLTTENSVRPGEFIEMNLLSGPFRDLKGKWTFTPLGANACKVALRMSYRFSSAILEKTVGPVFDRITDGFVEAFVRRAEEKFGAP